MSLPHITRAGSGSTPRMGSWAVFPQLLGASDLEKDPWGSGQSSWTCTPNLASLPRPQPPVACSASQEPAPLQTPHGQAQLCDPQSMLPPLLTLQELPALHAPQTPAPGLACWALTAGPAASDWPWGQRCAHALAGSPPVVGRLPPAGHPSPLGAETLQTWCRVAKEKRGMGERGGPSQQGSKQPGT